LTEEDHKQISRDLAACRALQREKLAKGVCSDLSKASVVTCQRIFLA